MQFPADMGMAYFGQSSDVYALLEMHYDNSEYRESEENFFKIIAMNLDFFLLSDIVDSSGFRLFFTETPRPIEIDSLSIGANVDVSHLIPPSQAEFTTYSYCRPSCTKVYLYRRPDSKKLTLLTFHNLTLASSTCWN